MEEWISRTRCASCHAIPSHGIARNVALSISEGLGYESSGAAFETIQPLNPSIKGSVWCFGNGNDLFVFWHSFGVERKSNIAWVTKALCFLLLQTGGNAVFAVETGVRNSGTIPNFDDRSLQAYLVLHI